MTKAKAKAANDTPGVGDNSAMADEDRKVLFFLNRNEYVRLLAAKKAADAALKNHGRQIKADLGEHGLAQIKLYEQSRTPEGEAKIKAEFEAQRQAMRWAGIPVNTQVDMFEDLAPLDERAFDDGEEAGLRGDTFANPYDENSSAGRLFRQGWEAGQAKLAEGFRKKETHEHIKADDGDDPFEDEFDAADPSKIAAE
jgi:hypothetical protein